ncbi:MAG: DNA-directed RNA polymerase subunit B [Thermoproteota archaeon]|nr:DNA-directed RNA polymerase subunit B [Candidatus Brockarchaeota archaeon]
MAEELSESDLWVVAEQYIRSIGLARHHIDSFNEFVDKDMQKIVDEVKNVEVTVEDKTIRVEFGEIRVHVPRIIEPSGAVRNVYPMEARMRNFTYSAPVYLEIKELRDGRETRQEVLIGEIPIMVNSRYCALAGLSPEARIRLGEDPYDPGGYFIINGSERVIVGVEDLAPNRIILEEKKIGPYSFYIARVFSTTVGYRTRVEVRLKGQSNELKVYLPGVGQEIPFVIMLRALGMVSDREIAEHVSPFPEIQELLAPSFDAAQNIMSKEDAIMYIGNRVAYGQSDKVRLNKTQNVLDKILLPHIGMDESARYSKALFLCEMAERILAMKLGWRPPDDKDHYKNKRIRLAGGLLAELFRTSFRRMVRDFRYQLEKFSLRHRAIYSFSNLITTSLITDSINQAMATGNWGKRLVGVTQLLDRTNYLSVLSHLRRIQSPLSRSQSNFDARDLHPTQWGKLDPNETPEGVNCGLVKNMSIGAQVSVSADKSVLDKILSKFGLVPVTKADPATRSTAAKIFIDGVLVGYSHSGEALVKEIRGLRRRGVIPPEINVAYYEFNYGGRIVKEIYFNADPGRVRRPLIVVEEGQVKLTKDHASKLALGKMSFEDLVTNGVVEFLDADEEENAVIAVSLKDVTSETTHLEISPILMFGVVSSSVPFAEHNHSPRNTYEAAMAKQALGLPFANISNSFYTTFHAMTYPQIPLVVSRVDPIIGLDKRPIGQNFMVAVLSHPYNMEDAIVLNAASIQRGLARSTTYKSYEVEARRYPMGEVDRIEKPDSQVRGYRGDEAYAKIEDDGIVSVEAEVKGGEVIVGRSSPPRFFEEYKELVFQAPARRDSSVALKPSESGYVDSVMITEDLENNRLIKVRIRDHRIPEIGDKFASRSGQKGVIGMLVPQTDMPFTEDGLVPDLLINPHAIPSRMTISHFLESLFGIAAALEGRQMDGTTFIHTPEQEVQKILEEHGFSPYGEFDFIDGVTGKRFRAKVFMGIIYYQRLHHMVKDKMHARARGQVQMLTHQPTEGRSRGGGLRFGEMERDCLVGHGAARLLQDRLLEESDRTIVYVCEKCGTFAYYDAKQKKHICPLCEKGKDVSGVEMSYAFKLLLQELMSLGIFPRLRVRERV